MSIIGVVGIGYVGIAVATKFAEVGNQVIGFDIVEEKINLVNSGKIPIKGDEPRLPELLEKVHKSGNLTATNDFSRLEQCEIIIIAVETPFDVVRKRPLYFSLKKACEDVGKYLQKDNLVIIESTLAPRTTDTIIKPILEKLSNLKVGKDFNLCHAPERVMPGKLLHNLENLDRVIGGVTIKCAERAKILYKEIVKGEIDITTPIMAEMVKTVENAYRDVQIAFANEVALLSEPLGIDVFKLRELVNKSPGRNILLPGTGVGGHCIPKDSWLLTFGSTSAYYPKLITTAREINDNMPHHVIDILEDALVSQGKDISKTTVTILGVAFLENSGDIRNSPTAPLVEDLKLINAEVRLYDPYVEEFMEIKTFKTLHQALTNSDALILATKHDEFFQINLQEIKGLMKENPIIIDGRNVFNREDAEKNGFFYQGIGKVKKN